MSNDKKLNIKKGGRPPLGGDSKRTIELTVIVNEKELKKIKSAIELSGEKYSSVFYRKVLLAAAESKTCNFKTIPETSIKVLDELSKLGVNANQIAKALNTVNKNGSLTNINEKEINDYTNRLIKLIKKMSVLFFK